MGFEFGVSKPLNCRVEVLNNKLGIKVLFISDIHLGLFQSEKVCRQILDTISLNKPELILIGGDLVDSRKGIPLIRAFIEKLSTVSKVAVVPGNHDHKACIKSIREAVILGKGIWLEDRPLLLICNKGRKCEIIGKLEQLSGKHDYSVLCTHDPAIFPDAVARKINLTLAGHLHGGQFVLYRHRGINFPGYFLNKWTRDIHKIKDSVLIVSKGITELLPIRFNCPREVVLCTL